MGHALGEPNTDALAELPMPVLMGWRDYFEITNSDTGSSSGHQYVDPMNALEVLRKRYGGK